MPSCLACRQKGTVSLRKIAVSTCEQEQSLRKLSLQQILRGLFLILFNLNRLNDLNDLNLHYIGGVANESLSILYVDSSWSFVRLELDALER
jgi:hypothetical protein